MQREVIDKIQCPVMRPIATCFVLLLSTAVATAEVGRLGRVPKRSSFRPTYVAFAGGRDQLNPQEDRAMTRRYQLNGQKEITSTIFKVQKKWMKWKRVRTLHDFFPLARNNRKCAISKFQKKWMHMIRTFLVPIPSRRNTMKCTIRGSCRFLTRPSSCLFYIPRSFPKRESSSSSFTGSKISSTTVNQLFK